MTLLLLLGYTMILKIPKQVIYDFNRQLLSLESDFQFIRLAIEQQAATLDKMRKFKHVKYSNGNRTIYDIVDGALQTISISNSGFVYHLDKELENYKIKPNGDKTLKNVDLLMAFLNHFKNSLEAKASTIVVNIDLFRNN